MTDQKRDRDETEAETETEEDKTATEELKQGLRHLFSAARKVIKTAEPTVSRSLDDAERVIGKIGRGGEVVATEVGKEVAALASRLADRIKTAAQKVDGEAPTERTPPEPPPASPEGGGETGGGSTGGGSGEDKSS